MKLQQTTNLNQKLKQPDLTRSRSRSGSPDYGYHQDKTNSQNNYLNQYTRSQLSFQSTATPTTETTATATIFELQQFSQLQQTTNLDQDKTDFQNNNLNQYTRSQLSYNPLQHQQPKQQQQQPFLKLQQQQDQSYLQYQNDRYSQVKVEPDKDILKFLMEKILNLYRTDKWYKAIHKDPDIKDLPYNSLYAGAITNGYLEEKKKKPDLTKDHYIDNTNSFNQHIKDLINSNLIKRQQEQEQKQSIRVLVEKLVENAKKDPFFVANSVFMLI